MQFHKIQVLLTVNLTYVNNNLNLYKNLPFNINVWLVQFISNK